jgi:parallel beta-helix repeat protein
MAVFLLGNLTKKSASNNLLHDNNVHDNNHANFGDPKSVVSGVPQGTGIIVVGTSNTEIRNNTVTGNNSTGVLVVSYALMQQLIPGATTDPKTNPYSDHIYVHDNTFMGNGSMPATVFSAVSSMMPLTLQDVLWDGWVAMGVPSTNDVKFCLGAKPPSFFMFAGHHIFDPTDPSMPSMDPTPYECTLPQIMGNPP